MDLNCAGLLVLVHSVFAIQTIPEKHYYHAAVVEYCPFEGADGNKTVWKNGQEYVMLIKEAAKYAEIVVFPETALNFEDTTVYFEVPFSDKVIAPADNDRLHPVLRMLSKAARDEHIYVSVCILEKYETSSKEVLRYNTNVVFDRKGRVVSRYRKSHLYNEEHLNTTTIPEIAIFDSDFGVRFGVFICADIFFAEPALRLVRENNITDFVYPNWSVAEMPFLAISLQLGWSYMTDSSLLSAGVTSLEQGSSGSGIFAGKKGPIVYIFNERNQTRILVGKLYKKGRIGQNEGKILAPVSEEGDSTLLVLPKDYQHFNTYLLTPQLDDNSSRIADDTKFNRSNNKLIISRVLKKTISQGSLTCEFSINATLIYRPLTYLNLSDISYVKNDSSFRYQYRLVAFDGVWPNPYAGLQICGIVSCLNESLSSCGLKTGNTLPFIFDDKVSLGDSFLYATNFNEIFISTVSKEKAEFTFPNLLESSQSHSPKAYGSLPNVSKMEFRADNFSSYLRFLSGKLMYAGLYSRIVSRDGGKMTNGNTKK